MSKRLANCQKGFTIVELLIATSIFAVMMLLATSGILYLGRIYYKGVIVSKTQDTSRSVIEDISRNIQTGGNKTVSSTPNPGGIESICVGQVRYSYIINKQLTPTGPLAANQVRHVLWTDRVIENVGCPPVSDINNPDTDANKEPSVLGRELLGANMRLANLYVSTKNSSVKPTKLYVKVVYGDLDLSPGDICISSRFGGQFCATSEITTFVKNRV